VFKQKYYQFDHDKIHNVGQEQSKIFLPVIMQSLEMAILISKMKKFKEAAGYQKILGRIYGIL